MAKFKQGDKVKFERGKDILKNIPIVYVIPFIENLNMSNDVIKKVMEDRVFEQNYIIEHPSGWVPDYSRVQQFGLDPKKKYIFVNEEELK